MGLEMEMEMEEIKEPPEKNLYQSILGINPNHLRYQSILVRLYD